MPGWLFPILKAVLPNIGTIVSTTAPIFTKKSADPVANQSMLLQQQITELQSAVSKNDAHIKALAVQIQNTVEALEKGASIVEKRHQRILFLCIVATVLSVMALCTVLFILFAQ